MQTKRPLRTTQTVPSNSKAVFRNNVQSWSTVEPAIDLTATTPLAFARAAAGLD